jgi:drug/metabolite transporter (DMT)-like permease
MQTTAQATSRTRNTILGYVVLSLIWGSTWLGIRILVRDVPPLEAAGVRFLVSGALLVSLAILQKRRWPNDRRSWNALFVLALTIMAVPYGLLFWAEQFVTSSMAAILFSASPLVVALLTPLMSHRRVPRSAIFAMVVAFGGLLVILYAGLSTNQSLWGGAAVLAAVVLSAWSIVYAKDRLHEIDSVIATGVQLLVGSLALLWGSWVFEAHRPAHWTSSALLSLGFLVIFGSCLAFVIYYWLLKRMQPYQLATTSLVVPIVAVLEGTLFAREMVPPLMLIAMLVVLASVGSVLRAEAAVERRHDILLLREDRS